MRLMILQPRSQAPRTRAWERGYGPPTLNLLVLQRFEVTTLLNLLTAGE